VEDTRATKTLYRKKKKKKRKKKRHEPADAAHLDFALHILFALREREREDEDEDEDEVWSAVPIESDRPSR
jgi:hypothetical protein